MSGIKFSNTTPPAPGGQSLVTFQADGNGNISAAYTPGGGGAGAFNGVNNQSGVISYTVVSGDNSKLIVLSDAAAVAVTLPNANTLASTWMTIVTNLGAGTVTITPTTSTIDGAASLTLAQFQGVVIFGDGTNYFTERGRATGGSGTVTSVAIAVPTGLSVSGSPITTSGTITISWANESANTFLAGPTTGAAAAPTFRTIVPADMPVFVASGASHASGAVPDPGASAGTTRFLREDATFAVPPASTPIFAQTAKRYSYFAPTPSSSISSAPQIGDVILGVGTVFANASTPTATRGMSTTYQAATTATYCGAHTATTAAYCVGQNINGMFDVFIARTTDIRCWIGVSSNSSLTVSDTPTGSYAMFRFSTVAGDTHWKCVTSNGTSQTVTDSGITADTNSHRFGIQFDDANSKVNFYIDGVLVGTNATNLPASGTVLFFNCVACWIAATINPIIGVAAVNIQTDF